MPLDYAHLRCDKCGRPLFAKRSIGYVGMLDGSIFCSYCAEEWRTAQLVPRKKPQNGSLRVTKVSPTEPDPSQTRIEMVRAAGFEPATPNVSKPRRGR